MKEREDINWVLSTCVHKNNKLMEKLTSKRWKEAKISQLAISHRHTHAHSQIVAYWAASFAAKNHTELRSKWWERSF